MPWRVQTFWLAGRKADRKTAAGDLGCQRLPSPLPAARPRVDKRLLAVPPRGAAPVPSTADLTSVVLRRCYEHAEAGEAEVTMRDVVAVLRLAHGIEHDAALAERDAALRRIEEWRHGLWSIRNAIVRQHGRPPGRRSRPRPRGTGRRCGRAALDAAVAALIQPTSPVCGQHSLSIAGRITAGRQRCNRS